MKKFFKKNMPDPDMIVKYRVLRIFSPLLKNPSLLHFNRRSISAGVFAGTFGAFIPLPVQMIVGVLLAILVRGNLAVAIGFTWFSNPLTYIPLYYFCYQVGEFILGKPTNAEGEIINIDIQQIISDVFTGNFDKFSELFQTAGLQLMSGCVLVGLVTGLLGYIAVSALWRAHVIRGWKRRKEKRQRKKHDPSDHVR